MNNRGGRDGIKPLKLRAKNHFSFQVVNNKDNRNKEESLGRREPWTEM